MHRYLLRFFYWLKSFQKGIQYKNVTFIPKSHPNDKTPWITYGSTKEDYTKWRPEICGICCLKMVGDTFGTTPHLSLHDLTTKCLEKGGFKIREDGTIAGIFHRPLLKLASEVGLNGTVERELDMNRIMKHLGKNHMVVLSIDLQKASSSYTGNHLILIHQFLPHEKSFLIHDCSYTLGKEGSHIKLSQDELAHMSNKRGITLWKR
jgi:hypothetical protein